MKILYLYTEMMGYQMPVLEELVHAYRAEVEVIYWDQNKKTPYIPKEVVGVKFRPRSMFSSAQLSTFAKEFAPDIIYISGWQDRAYLKTAKLLKAQGCPVVVGFDDQWRSSWRQIFGSLLVKFLWKNKYFSYAWVPGPYQYEYARHMGFSNDEIIFNLLTCDTKIFSEKMIRDANEVAPNFLFVGRFHRNKGIDTLIDAFKRYKNSGGKWNLICVGNGPLRANLNIEGISVEDFQTAEALRNLVIKSGAFVLPSHHEPWGVVAQEFSLAGLPLLLSDQVGSHPMFLIDGFNGYLFDSRSSIDLAQKMHSISEAPHLSLREMGERSRSLGLVITPEMSAASLMSVLKQ